MTLQHQSCFAWVAASQQLQLGSLLTLMSNNIPAPRRVKKGLQLVHAAF